jgi:hypothetical protein
MPRRKPTADVPPPAKDRRASDFEVNPDTLAQASGSGSAAFAMTLLKSVADGVSLFASSDQV